MRTPALYDILTGIYATRRDSVLRMRAEQEAGLTFIDRCSIDSHHSSITAAEVFLLSCQWRAAARRGHQAKQASDISPCTFSAIRSGWMFCMYDSPQVRSPHILSLRLCVCFSRELLADKIEFHSVVYRLTVSCVCARVR